MDVPAFLLLIESSDKYGLFYIIDVPLKKLKTSEYDFFSKNIFIF